MGLAGRKVKQRIGADPRNLTWADDAAKFGQQYLAKLGWDPSRGLGASGDGRTSHIKVAQKLNLLGIGAGSAKMADDTVAWKQNHDYEVLLKRLNESVEAEQGKEEGGEGTDDKEGAKGEGKKKKKRKRADDAADDKDDDKDRTKRKKDKKVQKEKKKKSKDKGKGKEVEKTEEERNEEDDAKSPSNVATTNSARPAVQAPVPRPMAHRARFLRSKQLASRSSTAVAEILGISSSSNSPGPSSLSGTSTPFPDSSEGGETRTFTPVLETNHDLRTSSTSVGDYFKEKLAARALTSASDRSKSSTLRPSESASLSISPSYSAPRPTSTLAPTLARAEVAKNVSRSEDDGETPRAGLGSKAGRVAAGTHDDGASPRVGLGAKFGSLMGGFSSSKPAENSVSDPPKNEGPPLPNSSEAARLDEQTSEKKKKKRKGEDGKEKKSKKSKEVVSERTDNDADVQPVVEDKTPTEGDCQKEKEIAQDSAERKEKKKRRKGKKEKRQEGSQ